MSVETDFQYVVKVVSSCQNTEQLETTKDLFENFKRKWKNSTPKMEMVNYMYRFESTYDSKKIRL